MSANDNIESYYAARSAEYDSIYDKPERQADLKNLERLLPQQLAGLDVLEIACGTGYWTQFIARSARKILATDYNPETIQIARTRNFGQCSIEFAEADAYSLETVKGGFSGGFCGFWWSHVPKQRLSSFLETFHARLTPGAKVVMLDNRYVKESSTPISRQDPHGNTYQTRELKDGSKYEILKNFPSVAEIENVLTDFGRSLRITLLEYYWLAIYDLFEKKPSVGR